MSTRLQVLLEEEELRELRDAAAREGLTLSAWVRRTLHEARRRQPHGDLANKLAAVRTAAGHDFPTVDIDQMLAEIDSGYRHPPPE